MEGYRLRRSEFRFLCLVPTAHDTLAQKEHGCRYYPVVLATWDICSKKSINNGSTQSFSPTGQSLSPQLYSSNQSFVKNAIFSSPQLYFA